MSDTDGLVKYLRRCGQLESEAADRIERAERALADERAIVDKIWKALDIATYEQAGGKAIFEIVASNRSELTRLSAARAAEQEAKRVMSTELREARAERDQFLEQIALREKSQLEKDMQLIMGRNNELLAKLAASEAALKEARDEIWKLEEAYEIRMRDSDDTEAKLAASEAARERLRAELEVLADNWTHNWAKLNEGRLANEIVSFVQSKAKMMLAALASPPAQAGVQLPTLSKDQEEYLQKIADATNKYDPAHVVGGPAQAGASEADTYGLRGGPGRDFPCDDPKVSECAMGECQRQRRCVLRAAPARDAVLEEAAQAISAMRWDPGEYDPAAVAAACCARIRALSARRGEGCA